MFSRRKITTVSALLGGLAAAFLAAPQAYAAPASHGCRHDDRSSTICIRESETVYASKDGRHTLRQRQHCSSYSRNIVVFPRVRLLSNQRHDHTHIGSVISCSNKAPHRQFKEQERDQDDQGALVATLRPVQDALRPLATQLLG
ncbi:hypothetical protein AB0C96_02105 [Streptomyces sp. NPDC048506]|uniref:hypothetical protein n=1 Tax=Streptomyces sp. NPDC048506 TaxID=3155028 RepID=UPI0034449B26